MKLSVIVVSWNVRDLLRECLHSLEREMSLPRDDWELVVADNDSEDGTVAMLRDEFPRAKVLANNENLGFGRANNRALHECSGEFVLLLNPDTIVLDHAVDRMVETLERHREAAAVGCRLQNRDGSHQRWTGGAAPGLLNVTCHFLMAYRVLPVTMLPAPLYLEHEPRSDVEVGWVSGACMLLRRESLGDAIFDERFFMYGEDMELCSRLIRRGGTVIYTPTASVVHLEGGSLDGPAAELKAGKLRSLREVFAMDHGAVALLYYDLVVFLGFLLRFLIFGLGSLWPSRHDFRARALRSGHFLAEAFVTLVLRRSPTRR